MPLKAAHYSVECYISILLSFHEYIYANIFLDSRLHVNQHFIPSLDYHWLLLIDFNHWKVFVSHANAYPVQTKLFITKCIILHIHWFSFALYYTFTDLVFSFFICIYIKCCELLNLHSVPQHSHSLSQNFVHSFNEYNLITPLDRLGHKTRIVS